MLIKLSDVKKTYKENTVLSIKELEFEKGKIYGIVGKNGAGKTTLFRILAGLTPPTAGTVTKAGDFNQGVLIEYPALDPTMSGRDNLLWMRKLNGKRKCREIEELLEIVNLKEAGNRKVNTYSLGMKQRLGLAMCLLPSPEVLILDEPMNGLDPDGIIEFRKMLQKIHEEGTTILISSHILDELHRLATDYVFMKEGKAVKKVSGEELPFLTGTGFFLKTTNDEDALSVLQKEFRISGNKEEELIAFQAEADRIEEISKKLAENGIYILRLFEKTFRMEDYYNEVLNK